MEKQSVVGYRFHPTDDELINHYLKNKILGNNTSLIEETISEIDVYNYDPVSLRSLSKIQSGDLIYYFFVPKKYTNSKRNLRKRSSNFGNWKLTGDVTEPKDKNDETILWEKKVLVYQKNGAPKVKGKKSPWTMHEYQITHLPFHNLNLDSYVICKIFDKCIETDISYGNNEPIQLLNSVRAIATFPQVEQAVEEIYGFSLNDEFDPNTCFSDNYNNNPDLQQLQTPYLSQADDEFLSRLKHVNRAHVDHLFSDSDMFSDINMQVQTPYLDQDITMQEHLSNYKPKESLSVTIVDYNSDCDSDRDAESISETSYKGPSSPNDSVDSSNRDFPSFSSTDSCKDHSISRKNQESELTRHTIPTKQEVKGDSFKAIDASMEKEPSMVKTEKKGLFITEYAMERNCKNPPYIYLMNMIIGFILLVALISNIMSICS